jgi:alpha-1,3-glucan synthase
VVVPTESDLQADRCIESLIVPAFGFMTFVPSANWTAPQPSITDFAPGHDFRVLSDGTSVLDISFEFEAQMDCESVTDSITLDGTTQDFVTPFVDIASVECALADPSSGYIVSAASHSVWRWSARLLNVSDGIYQLTMSDPVATSGSGTGVSVGHGISAHGLVCRLVSDQEGKRKQSHGLSSIRLQQQATVLY